MTSRLRSSTTALIVALSFLTVQVLSAQTATSSQPPAGPQPIAEGFGAGAYRPQAGISDPVALKQVQPKYTSDALRARIQGQVELEAVIQVDGTVGPVRVVKSLDGTLGLDQEAIRAAQQWRFLPAMYGGKPVPMLVILVLEFRHPSAPYTPQPMTQADRTWVDDAEFLKGVARLGQPDVTMPTLVKSVEPKYTSDAMRAKIAGTVVVDMVVGPDGTVVRARLSRSFAQPMGLDGTALDAARQWQFKPGLVKGQPANVLVTATMEFRLH